MQRKRIAKSKRIGQLRHLRLSARLDQTPTHIESHGHQSASPHFKGPSSRTFRTGQHDSQNLVNTRPSPEASCKPLNLLIEVDWKIPEVEEERSVAMSLADTSPMVIETPFQERDGEIEMGV